MRAVLITTILTLAGAGTAFAADTGVIHGRTVGLYQEQSTAGESLDAFVVRIAPRAVQASKTARATVCGQLNGTGPYTVTIKTDGFLSTCDLPESALPYVLINGTAVDVRENTFSQVNWQRAGYLVTPWSVKYQDGRQKRPRAVR
ncbi:hypothetical protein [Stenotrophomonas bentonitica]|uniref:hypothetical protein n=1 Tax=Stenotrophomonas bentonitica TaxID=1450134 RepID=UPI00345EA0E0